MVFNVLILKLDSMLFIQCLIWITCMLIGCLDDLISVSYAIGWVHQNYIFCVKVKVVLEHFFSCSALKVIVNQIQK